MNYHNIVYDDMLNGPGLRITLFVSGCDHECPKCQNPQTWDKDSGILFDEDTMIELIDALNKPYIKGLTLSGGDPLNENNIKWIEAIIKTVRDKLPDKDIWLYTGYTWEEILDDHKLSSIVKQVDVVVEGPYVDKYNDVHYHWAGSTNQRVINIKESELK